MALRKVIQILPNTSDQTVQLVMNTGREVDIKVEMCKVVLDPDNNLVYLYDNSNSQTATGASINEPNYYSLNFNDITTPVASDASDLRDLLVAMLQFVASGGGGGGDATSANQLIQINELKAGTGQASVFKDTVSDKSVFIDGNFNHSVFKKDNGQGVFIDVDNDESWFKQIHGIEVDTYGRFTDPNNGESVFLTVFDTSVFKNASGDSVFSNGSDTIAELLTSIKGFQNVSGGSVFKDVNDNPVFIDPLVGDSVFYDTENSTPYLKEAVSLLYDIDSAMATVLNAAQIFIARPESANVITAPPIGPYVALADLCTALNTYRGTGDFFELSCQIIFVSVVVGYYAVITYSNV